MLRTGEGVPKRISDTWVAIRDPPQPSRKGRAEGLEEDVPIIVIHTHMGAVERFDNHPVNAQRCYRPAPPNGLLPDRGETERRQGFFLKHEFFQEKVGKLQGDRFFCASFFLYTVAPRYASECLFILDHVVTDSAFRYLFQQEDQVAAVIGMGCRTSGYFAQEVPGDDRVGIGPADTARGLHRDPAGPHVADPAAKSF